MIILFSYSTIDIAAAGFYPSFIYCNSIASFPDVYNTESPQKGKSTPIYVLINNNPTRKINASIGRG